jgi:hypothetical protein
MAEKIAEGAGLGKFNRHRSRGVKLDVRVHIYTLHNKAGGGKSSITITIIPIAIVIGKLVLLQLSFAWPANARSEMQSAVPFADDLVTTDDPAQCCRRTESRDCLS